MKTLAFLSILVLAPLTALANTADDPDSSRTISPSEFESCALRALESSGELQQVLEECEAEMNAYIESEQPPRVTREKAEAPLEKAAAAKESERIRLAAFAMSRSSSFHDRRHLRFSITSRWTVLRLPGDRTI